MAVERDIRERFDKACDRFDLANDAVAWAGYPDQSVHPANGLRRELDLVWREADAAGVDVSDIAWRWRLGR